MLRLIKLICVIGMLVGSCGAVQADDFPSYMYRVEIMTPGGALPFIMKTGRVYEERSPGSRSNSKPVMVVFNGTERIQCEMPPAEWTRYGERRDLLGRIVRRSSARHVVDFPQYDSSLEWVSWHGAGFDRTSNRVMQGLWKKRRGDAVVELPAIITEIDWELPITDAQRFVPFQAGLLPEGTEPADYTGRWIVQFESADESAIGVFEVDEDQLATGTFMTTTGDYRFLSGRVDGSYLRLSTFDGAHAFLFHAEMQDDGSIKGDFWSGNWWHETWTAVRDDDATLPDAFDQTTVTDERALEEAVFKDIEGNPTRVFDALDATNAKARVLEIFGTWCPNCSDAGRELVSLKEKYGDDLGIVALAFEVTEDFERSSQQVQRHHEHIGSDWEILIAGLSDKAKATETLGFLDKVRSYPTLIFLNERNEVQAVYSGFSGPATGEAYTRQRERFEALIEGLVEE
ncbi:MAG: TlpA family protein disulfide reductase [Phycisphaerales bacterium]